MSFALQVAFNNSLNETLNMISNKFPLDKHIEYTKNQVEVALSISERQLVSGFLKSVQPYLHEITTKNDVFFISMAGNSKELECFNLAEKWSFFTDAEKEKLWKYVQKLVVLGKKIMQE